MLKKILYNQISEGDGGGGGAPTKTETPPAAQAPQNNAPSQTQRPELDNFGYEKPPKQTDQPPKEDPKPGEKTTESKTVQKPEEKKIEPGTGYGEKPPEEPKVDDKPEDPAATPPASPAVDDVYKDIKFEGMFEGDDKKLLDYAKKNVLSKEALQSLVDIRKEEFKAAVDAQKKLVDDAKKQNDKIRVDWDKELRTGWGDKYANNLKNVEKVLDQYFPDTKKKLTESKGMLPPHVMREMCALAEHIFATEKFVQGGPAGAGDPKPEDKKEHKPWDFYNG